MRHYYLTRSGRLRRKDNTLCFEPAADKDESADEEKIEKTEFSSDEDHENFDETLLTGENLGADFLGDLNSEPIPEPENDLSVLLDENSEKPARVSERRVIPVEDVDALWSFRELDLNSKVLNFLAQK